MVIDHGRLRSATLCSLQLVWALRTELLRVHAACDVHGRPVNGAGMLVAETAFFYPHLQRPLAQCMHHGWA